MNNRQNPRSHAERNSGGRSDNWRHPWDSQNERFENHERRNWTDPVSGSSSSSNRNGQGYRDICGRSNWRDEAGGSSYFSSREGQRYADFENRGFRDWTNHQGSRPYRDTSNYASSTRYQSVGSSSNPSHREGQHYRDFENEYFRNSTNHQGGRVREDHFSYSDSRSGNSRFENRQREWSSLNRGSGRYSENRGACHSPVHQGGRGREDHSSHSDSRNGNSRLENRQREWNSHNQGSGLSSENRGFHHSSIHQEQRIPGTISSNDGYRPMGQQDQVSRNREYHSIIEEYNWRQENSRPVYVSRAQKEKQKTKKKLMAEIKRKQERMLSLKSAFNPANPPGSWEESKKNLRPTPPPPSSSSSDCETDSDADWRDAIEAERLQLEEAFEASIQSHLEEAACREQEEKEEKEEEFRRAQQLSREATTPSRPTSANGHSNYSEVDLELVEIEEARLASFEAQKKKEEEDLRRAQEISIRTPSPCRPISPELPGSRYAELAQLEEVKRASLEEQTTMEEADIQAAVLQSLENMGIDYSNPNTQCSSNYGKPSGGQSSKK